MLPVDSSVVERLLRGACPSTRHRLHPHDTQSRAGPYSPTVPGTRALPIELETREHQGVHSSPSVARTRECSQEDLDSLFQTTDAMGLKLATALALAVLSALAYPSDARAQDPAVFYIGGAALAAILPGLILALPQPDAHRSFLKASAGQFDAVDDENKAIDFLLEYQPGKTWHRIKPLFGIAGNSDASLYGWVAAAYDLHIGKRFVVNVNTGPAFYLAGDAGKKLGSLGVLRSGFEVGYRFYGEARVTASFHHMSHGKLLNGDLNPGVEVIAVNLTWPLN